MSESPPATAKCPEPLCCRPVLPPGRRRPASPRRTLLPRHRSYGLMRRTAALPPPLALASCDGSLQVAVSPCCATVLPDVVSVDPCLRVWTPTPAAPRVHVPVASPRTMAFPQLGRGRRVRIVPTATSVGDGVSELQSFTNVQTHRFARHTGSSHPRVSRRRAAVAFTSAPITVRCLPVQRICLLPKSGQLAVNGLSPFKIDSLVGCSPNHSIERIATGKPASAAHVKRYRESPTR